MKKKKILGIILFLIGIFLGFYASGRNCLFALITRGEMNFWTGIEILAGVIALLGVILILLDFRKRSKEAQK